MNRGNSSVVEGIMSKFTLDDFRRIIVECAGADNVDALNGDILEVSFEQLGYDSLALLETASRVERELLVSLPDETVVEATTPGEFIALVEERLTQRA
jgi:minimal PKS acyl carrier protein